MPYISDQTAFAPMRLALASLGARRRGSGSRWN